MRREPIFVAVDLFRSLDDKRTAADFSSDACADVRHTLKLLEVVPPQTMAAFAAKLRLLADEVMGEHRPLIRQLRDDFDSVYVDTACPLGMLYATWAAVMDHPEWTDDAEAINLILKLATRLPPPTTEAGRGCLDLARDQYEDGMSDDAGAAKARKRIELIADAEAWAADQQAKIAEQKRKLAAAA